MVAAIRIVSPVTIAESAQPQPEKEWLVTNGLGGYASGTVSGIPTRRYHGLLTAAYPPPLGRYRMLNALVETLNSDVHPVHLSPRLQAGECGILESFFLENGLPVWHFSVLGLLIERRIFMPYRQNAVHICYRLISGSVPVLLQLRPKVEVAFKPHDEPLTTDDRPEYIVQAQRNLCRIGMATPDLTMFLMTCGGGEFVNAPEMDEEPFLYSVEKERGYPYHGRLWSPGYFMIQMAENKAVAITAATEDPTQLKHPFEAQRAELERRTKLIESGEPAARIGVAAELLLAADQFVISPPGRGVEAGAAAVEAERTIIAGYHWFTDWGRDAMISLEGLTLLTGRYGDARKILITFMRHTKGGLIPNLFPEGNHSGVYNTADATFWFFHALSRYLAFTGDKHLLRSMLPTLKEIIANHICGTHYGIGVDPSDSLLKQGAEGLPLTWMDARTDDWVVTPRRGKAVEINALWYNAVKLMSSWSAEEQDAAYAAEMDELARRVKNSFNERFWYQSGGYLYDVVEGDEGNDASCRPNQVLALSLPHPVLDPEKWRPVIDTVLKRLATPVGLRSLDPAHPDYRPVYQGDRRARDVAYHQGTIWAWLSGPFVDAWVRTYPDRRPEARQFLLGLTDQLQEQCIGTIGEIFDAESPFLPRGCVSQAWSVAETLRGWLLTEPD